MLHRVVWSVLAAAGAAPAELLYPLPLDDLVLHAEVIVQADVVGEGAIEVRTAFRGAARAGARIRIHPRCMLERLGNALARSGTAEQRYEGFTLASTGATPLGESLRSGEGQAVLWAGALDWRLAVDVDREAGGAACRAGEEVVGKFAELHAARPEEMRHAIALAVRENAPAKYAALRPPCPPFPWRLSWDRRGGRNFFVIHRPHVDPPPKFVGDRMLVLVRLRGGARIELPAPAGVLARAGSISFDGLEGVDPGRYRAYLRLGPAGNPWSESYGCTVKSP